eukprot:1769126-Rhodomonas_salina.2
MLRSFDTTCPSTHSLRVGSDPLELRAQTPSADTCHKSSSQGAGEGGGDREWGSSAGAVEVESSVVVEEGAGEVGLLHSNRPHALQRPAHLTHAQTHHSESHPRSSCGCGERARPCAGRQRGAGGQRGPARTVQTPPRTSPAPTSTHHNTPHHKTLSATPPPLAAARGGVVMFAGRGELTGDEPVWRGGARGVGGGQPCPPRGPPPPPRGAPGPRPPRCARGAGGRGPWRGARARAP